MRQHNTVVDLQVEYHKDRQELIVISRGTRSVVEKVTPAKVHEAVNLVLVDHFLMMCPSKEIKSPSGLTVRMSFPKSVPIRKVVA